MFFKSTFLAIGWSLIVLTATLVPGKTIPNVPIVGIDKVVHFFIFGVLMFLTTLGLRKYSNMLTKSIPFVLVSFLYSLCYGIVIEIIQQYIPGRSFSVYDIIANSIGVVLGYIVFRRMGK